MHAIKAWWKGMLGILYFNLIWSVVNFYSFWIGHSNSKGNLTWHTTETSVIIITKFHYIKDIDLFSLFYLILFLNFISILINLPCAIYIYMLAFAI